MEQLRPDLFEAFHGVMNATYELHDQMFGAAYSGRGVTSHIMLVSDHGFLSGETRVAAGR